MPDNFNNNDERDRTVPPEEDYYGRVRPDLDFNAKVSHRGEYGINPTTEYQYYQTESGLNRKIKPRCLKTAKSLKKRQSKEKRQSNRHCRCCRDSCPGAWTFRLG